MAFTISLDTDKPQGSQHPSTIDNDARDAREGFRERLDVDHVFTKDDGQTTIDDDDGQGIGHHKHITLVTVYDTDVPTIGATEGLLFLKAVDAASELHWKNGAGAAKQITVGGKFNLTVADVGLTDGEDDLILFDDDTITVNVTTGKIELKNGTDGTGVKARHLDFAAGAFVDDVTLEIANEGTETAKVQAKVPAVPDSGGDLYPSTAGLPYIMTGSYTGQDADQDIVVFPEGFELVTMRIKCSDNTYGATVLVNGTTHIAWNRIGANIDATVSVILSGRGLKVKDGGLLYSNVNGTGLGYSWYAIGRKV